MARRLFKSALDLSQMSLNGLKLKSPFFISWGITAHLTETHLREEIPSQAWEAGQCAFPEVQQGQVKGHTPGSEQS